MQFSIAETPHIYEGIAQYHTSGPGEFTFSPFPYSDYSILFEGAGYVELCVDLESERAVFLGGVNPRQVWIKQFLTPPTYVMGKLNVFGLNKRLKGTAKRYLDNWVTCYDEKSGWVCIRRGNLHGDSPAVEFAKNTLAIVENGELVSLWIKPDFV